MKSSFRIGTLFGIPIQLHFTFLIVIPLFTWIIGSEIGFSIEFIQELFGPFDDSIVISLPYLFGFMVTLGLFLGVLVHELAHSLIAKRKGIKIHSITLLILGGVSSLEEGIPDPRVELPMALAGPMTSLGVGIACWFGVLAVHSVAGVDPAAGAFFYTLGYLAVLNMMLFGFNLLPAFPMDGGRVLRAWLAKRMPLGKATKIAADVGKGFAILFAILGFLAFNPILIIIGFFIYIGAGQEFTVLRHQILLKDLTAGQVMNSPVVTVPPDLPISRLIELMYTTKHLGFPVVDGGRLIGIVTLADVQKSPPLDREALLVKDVMTREVLTLPPEAPLIEAFKLMSERQIGHIPVVSPEGLMGILTRTDILKVMELQEI